MLSLLSGDEDDRAVIHISPRQKRHGSFLTTTLLLLGLLSHNTVTAFTTTSTSSHLFSSSASTRGIRQELLLQNSRNGNRHRSSLYNRQQLPRQQPQRPLSVRLLALQPQPPRYPPPSFALDGTSDNAVLVDGVVDASTTAPNNGKSVPVNNNNNNNNSKVDDDEDVLALFKEDDPSTTPRPDPQTLSETVVEQRQLFEEAEERVSLLQGLVEDYQEQLEARERLLQSERDSWSMEKIGLLAQVAEWTKLVQSLQQDDESQVADSMSDQKERQEQLQEEINDIKAELKEAQLALQSEREAAQQVKARLLQAEDQLEFEQMRFQKEKDQLLLQVNSSKTRLDDVERTLQQTKVNMEQDRSTYQQQLQEETARLQNTQKQLEQIQKEFDQERAAMEQQMKEQRLRYLEAQDTLGQEQTQFEEERVRLESMVESEKTKLKQLEQRWKRDQQQFQATKEDLEMKIVFEKKRVEELSTKLEQEMERFNQEKATLEDRLDEERTRLMEVQAQLAEEQLLFEEEKADLEYKLSEEIRIGLLKKRQMNNRFESIRKELTALWQGAKREARVERERLTKKYEEQLEAMALNVQSLEQDLERATKSSGDMRAQVQSVEASKIRLQQEYNDMELRYRTTLAQRNLEISDLQATVSDLRSNLQVREAILERYETSFREIAKLGWNLGKKRAKKAAKRVRGWVSLKRDNI